MSNYVITRPVAERDLPSVVDLDYEAFTPYGTTEDPHIFTARFKVFPQGFVVAELNDNIVGYACSEKWLSDREPTLDENPEATHSPDGTVFCITGMAIRRAYQRQMIGSLLLQDLLRIAREQGCTKVILETSNARAFYVKHGFSKSGERSQNGTLLHIMIFNFTQ
ncbi:MAG: GNAT family N-acetyltransferase [Chloroflexi bacterium]|nr:GNAT family N-acetyltransferase [Chloroflexota bacterium]